MQAPLQVWTARLLALAAAGVAWFLYLQGGAAGLPGCDLASAFDCEGALASRWGAWLTLPVSLMGAATYSVFFLGACLVGTRLQPADALGWRLLEFCVPACLGAAAWFLGVQAIGAAPACLYCLVVHALGGLASVLVVWSRVAAGSSGHRHIAPLPGMAQPAAGLGSPAPPALGLPTLAGVLGLVSLVAGQVFFAQGIVEREVRLESAIAFDTPTARESADAADPSAAPPQGAAPPADEAPPAEEASDEDGSAAGVATSDAGPPRKPGGKRPLALLNGALKIDVYEHPLIGSPEAPHVVVELMDYACPHCHKFHEMAKEARKRFGGRVAIVVMPTPGEILCNRYVQAARPSARGACRVAKLAVAVSMARPEAFPGYHDWLMGVDELRPAAEAVERAYLAAGDDAVNRVLDDHSAEKRVANYIELYAALSKGGPIQLPCEILGDTVAPGAPLSVDELVDVWRRKLGAVPDEPPGPASQPLGAADNASRAAPGS